MDLNGTGTLLKGPAVPGVGSAARSGSEFWECAGQTGRPGSGGRLPAPSSSFLGKGKRVEYPDKDSALAPREYQCNGNMNDNHLEHNAFMRERSRTGELPLWLIRMKAKGCSVSLHNNEPGFTLPSNIGELGDDIALLDLRSCSLQGALCSISAYTESR